MSYRLSSCQLHILAMLFMLSDHLWATFFGTQRWMTGIGRIAFPIFAFLIVEGFFHTSNIKKYRKRLLICALLSEIPFNFLMSGRWYGPFHQNVLWTFYLGLLLIALFEQCKKWIGEGIEKISNKFAVGKATKVLKGLLLVAAGAGISYIAYFIGNITFVDYFGAGVLTVLVFYFFHERKWYVCILLAVALYYINAELLAGMYYPLQIGKFSFEFPEQGIAVFALLPIWLYNGRQGYHAKWFRNFCYGFYPAHMLLLALLSRFI